MKKKQENKSVSKKTLLSSVIVLIVCIAMLLGTTFAWFTDSVSNTGNRIQAGTLKVKLLKYDETAAEYKDISNGSGDIFKADAGKAQNSNDTLWEPGKTQIVYLAVENAGNLAVKYNAYIDVTDEGLVGSLEYVLVENPNANGAPFELSGKTWADIKTLTGVDPKDVAAGRSTITTGVLDEIAKGTQNERDYVALAVHMKEDAGNAYQDKDIIIDVTIAATQMTAEEDGFGSDQYDKLAELPAVASFKPVTGEVSADQTVTTEGAIKSATVKANAVNGVFNEMKVEGAESNSLVMTLNVEKQGEVTTEDEQTKDKTTKLDLTIDMTAVMKSVKDGNTTTTNKNVLSLQDYVIINLALGKGLSDVSATHNGTAMVKSTETTDDTGNGIYSYDTATGILTIKTKTFSPFAVTYKLLCPEVLVTLDSDPTDPGTGMTLAAFRDSVNAGNTYAGYTVTQQKDINMNSVTSWTPIGDESTSSYDEYNYPFAGTYDGGGFKIANFNITSSTWGAGLFGDVQGTIKNLTIKDSSVTGIGGSCIIGIMLNGTACATNCKLENCHVSSTGSCGLMFSYFVGPNCSKAKVESCSTDANCWVKTTGGYQTGGIFGQITIGNGVLSVKNCVNRADVTSFGAAGGISGQSNGVKFEDCENYGTIVSTGGYGNDSFVGGIAGNIGAVASDNDAATIIDCSNYGNVSTLGLNSPAGGIFGQNPGDKKTVAERCINTGNVTGAYASGIGLGLYHYNHIAKYCYNSGSVNGSKKAYGIFGDSIYDTIGCGPVNNSLSAGSVESSSKYSISSGNKNDSYYYDSLTLKTAAGDNADVATALTALNTGLETAFWGLDPSDKQIKPLSLITAE